jgi:hypothetical protein
MEEQGPLECWAVVVVALELWWLWQISQVFFSLDYHFCSSWCCRGLLCDEVHRDQWTKEMTSLPFIITHFSWY